jgi:hypothetical protein
VIQRVEISILGCSFDAGEGQKVLQFLMNVNESGVSSAGGSELSEIEITITARDILTPAAQGVSIMPETLALDTSPIFSELISGVKSQKFRSLRKVTVKANLGLDAGNLSDPKWVAGWKDSLEEELNRDRNEACQTLQKRVIDVEVSFNRSPNPATMHYYTPKQFLMDKNMGMLVAATMNTLGPGAAASV